MARKHQLRKQRTGTVINLWSKKQERQLGIALAEVAERLQAEFAVRLRHEKHWYLSEIVAGLRVLFPDVEFADCRDTSSMRPDGGILSVEDRHGALFPVLIVEVKNQGTNVLRQAEGKKRQAMGNAIERLGKNVIGFRAAMIHEGIVPFVCFGDGCDFAESSSILDRVVTIGMFGPLNKVQVVNQGDGGPFNRGSFFFREKPWTPAEMSKIMYEIAQRSVFYYFATYGKDVFQVAAG